MRTVPTLHLHRTWLQQVSGKQLLFGGQVLESFPRGRFFRRGVVEGLGTRLTYSVYALSIMCAHIKQFTNVSTE